MCGLPSTSVEHVPPRCLFPERKDLPDGVDLRKQLITVPSCDEHNLNTSKDDEYLLYVLLMNLANNKYAERHFNTKIIRAIQRNPSVMALISKYNIPVITENIETGERNDSLAFKVDVTRVNSSINKIGRAIHFHKFGEKWHGDISVHSNFLLSLENDNSPITNSYIENLDASACQLFLNQEHYGCNPQIFSYQVISIDHSIPYIMQLHFYEGARFTLIFKSSCC
jgi:hypothetical protein